MAAMSGKRLLNNLVALSVEDPMAQDLLWEYAQRRRAVDVEFSEDLKSALTAAGFNGPVFLSTKAPGEFVETILRDYAEMRDTLTRAQERGTELFQENTALKNRVLELEEQVRELSRR